LSALVCHRHRVGCGACARRPDHAGSGRAFRPALIVNPIRPIRRATVRHRVCPRQQTGGQLCVSPTCSHQECRDRRSADADRRDEVVDEHHTRHADADVVERNRRVGAQPYVMPPAPARLRLPRRVCASTASERQRATVCSLGPIPTPTAHERLTTVRATLNAAVSDALDRARLQDRLQKTGAKCHVLEPNSCRLSHGSPHAASSVRPQT